MVISHIRQSPQGEWFLQSNEEHSENVALLSQQFAAKFQCAAWGKAIGMPHDLGKASIPFQRYICGNSRYMPHLANSKREPHAYVGAIAAKHLYPSGYPIPSICIMAHHAGLPDCGNFRQTMSKEIPEEITFSRDRQETLSLPFQPAPQELHLLIRMLYSCLVDADYLDTEKFMNEEQSLLRRQKAKLADLLPFLERHLAQLRQEVTDTPVNRIRAEVQHACLLASCLTPGFFSLTVPTGGGKTLSSLVWAIHHAIRYHKERIIIAIPYTSIIVQTAQVLRSIFGDANVLEHHSNIDTENGSSSKLQKQMKLASENWDAPIVVTTNVQLFESLFSNKPSKCRKLHNLCNSVIILDEVQTLPLEFLRPIVDSLKTLRHLFGASVLFTTASQPVIDGEIRCGKRDKDRFEGIEEIHEIISDKYTLSQQLRRVQIHFDSTTSGYDDIADRIARHPRVLCIVNTRSDAEEIFSRLPAEGKTYHLSRMMCPMHIRLTIEEIKEKLKSEDEPVIRVIATQLIEAGVDIDFPVVFRQEAGLDSILQAAGRCNREGKLAMGHTYVFKLNKPLPPGSLSRAASAMNDLQTGSDWFHPETMRRYFTQLYSKIETFDKASVSERLYRPWDFYFETVANEFRLIDDNATGVVVDYGNSLELIEQLKKEGPSYTLIKRLNQYTVSLHERDFRLLCKEHLIEEVVEGIYILTGFEQYSPKVGLIRENRWLDEVLIQ